MFEKVSERSNSTFIDYSVSILKLTTLAFAELDMMIDDAADRFRDAYGIEELTDPSAISQVC
jgi:hypothetical protein